MPSPPELLPGFQIPAQDSPHTPTDAIVAAKFDYADLPLEVVGQLQRAPRVSKRRALTMQQQPEVVVASDSETPSTGPPVR